MSAISLPWFLHESSAPYFDLPIGWDRGVLIVTSILRLQFAIVLLDLILCIGLRNRFLFTNTTVDPQRKTRPSRSWYTFSLLTNDYPGRWFLLHAFWNFGITLACIPDVLETIYRPSVACMPAKSYNLLPTLMSMALHLYHCVAPWFWHKFTREDFFHHIVFAIGGLGSISVLWPWGPGANFAFLFLTGLPGGLDYLMLGMVKLKLMNRLSEKSINSAVNAWIRGPGCTIAAAWTYSAWREGSGSLLMGPPSVIVVLNFVLIFTNGNYYSQRVVSNEARCRTLETAKKSSKEE